VIGGFGRVGQTVARLLKAEKVPYAALDTSGEIVTETRKGTSHVYLGDAGRSEMIERLGVKHARAFVVTVDEPKAAERMVAIAREINPRVPVFARAADPAHAVRLLRLGAVNVIPEAVEASLQLGAQVLEALGLPEDAVERRVDQARAEELVRLTGELDKS
jgi:CPA2 family monovalent cation:H+ antiporter-2